MILCRKKKKKKKRSSVSILIPGLIFYVLRVNTSDPAAPAKISVPDLK